MSLSTHLRNAGQYAKSLESLLGSVLVLGTVILGFTSVLPEDAALAIATALSALTVFRVWLARNTTAIDRAGDVVGDLTDRLRHS